MLKYGNGKIILYKQKHLDTTQWDLVVKSRHNVGTLQHDSFHGIVKSIYFLSYMATKAK